MDSKSTELGETLKVFLKVCQIGNKVGAVPFEWDKETQKLVKTKSSVKRIAWYIEIAYCFVYVWFMFFRLIQAACCMDVKYGVLFTNLLSVATIVTTVIFHVNTFIHSDDILVLVNHIIGTGRTFEGSKESNRQDIENSKTKHWDKSSPARKIMTFTYFYSCSQFLIALNSATKNPKYWVTLLPNARSIPKWKLIPFAAFEFMFSFTAASQLLFNILLNLVYSRNTIRCLSILNECKNPVTIEKLYRMLQIVNSRFNCCLNANVQPLLTLTVLIVNILSNYATFRLYQEVPMPGFLAFPGVFIATSIMAKASLSMSGTVVDKSTEFVRLMEEKRQNSREFAKFLKSCNLLKVWVRAFYYINHTSILTFYQIVIDNTVFMLLTF